MYGTHAFKKGGRCWVRRGSWFLMYRGFHRLYKQEIRTDVKIGQSNWWPHQSCIQTWAWSSIWLADFHVHPDFLFAKTGYMYSPCSHEGIVGGRGWSPRLIFPRKLYAHNWEGLGYSWIQLIGIWLVGISGSKQLLNFHFKWERSTFKNMLIVYFLKFRPVKWIWLYVHVPTGLTLVAMVQAFS